MRDVIACLLLTCLLTPPLPATDVHAESRTASLPQVMDFDFETGWILLPVTVAGETGPWVLDSGASWTVLDSTYAVELDLEQGDAIRILGATQGIHVHTLPRPPALAVGDLVHEAQQMVMLDLHGMTFAKHGVSIRGILGRDFLRQYVTRIDYANRSIEFHDPATYVYDGAGRVFANALRNELFFLPVTVDSTYHCEFAVDLGAGSLSFHYPFARDHQLLETPGLVVDGMDAGGPTQRKICRFTSLDLADVTVENPVIEVPLNGTGAFASEAFDGNAGNSLFRHFVMTLDYRNRQIILEKGEDSGDTQPALVSGISFLLQEDGQIVVHRVLDGSGAAEAGLRKGDLVIAQDGQPVVGVTGLRALREVWHEAGRRSIPVTVSRDGTQRDCVVVVKDMLPPARTTSRAPASATARSNR